jgi:hypothetical protein
MERESEYIKDRLNQQIRNLTRENSMLKDSLFRRDKEIIDAQNKLYEADRVTTFLGVCLGVVSLVAVAAVISAVRMSP